MSVMRISLLALPFVLNCSALKYNSHVGSDGTNGYLRTYYSSAKEKNNRLTDGTGIEQCKVQGSDVICKDLSIIHIEANSMPTNQAVVSETQAPSAPGVDTKILQPVKNPAAAQKAPTAAKGAPRKK